MSKIIEDIEKASELIAKALNSSGYKADFSPESLWEIDRFFEEQTRNGAPKRGSVLSEGLGYKIFALGAYVGEVLRHCKGGKWVGDDDDPRVEVDVQLHLSDGSVCWPMQRVIKRCKNGQEDGIGVYGLAFGLPVGPQPAPPPSSKPWWKIW